MSRVLFNLLASLLVALLLCAGAAFALVFAHWPGVEAIRELPNRELIHHFAHYALLLLPLVCLVPPAFAFWRVEDTGGRPYAYFIAPALAALLAGLGLAAFGQLTLSDHLYRTRVERAFRMEEAQLEAKVKELSSLEELESRWKRNPKEAGVVLARLHSLGSNFPGHLDLFRLLDRIQKEELLRLAEEQPTRGRDRSGLEARAEEARNRRDWALAALLYQKLIDQLPQARPFLLERKRLEAAREAALALERDPSLSLTEAELREQHLREELLALDRELDAGKSYEAFPKARELMLVHGQRSEVKDRYQKAEALLRRDEFLVQDLLLRKSLLPSAPALAPVRFTLGAWTLRAERLSWSLEHCYFENPVLEHGNQRWAFRYGRANGDRMLLKNGEERSQVLSVPGIENAARQALLLLPALRPELYFLSPFALERHRNFVVHALGQRAFFLQFLRDAKLFLPLYLLGLGLLLLGLAWWNREHLLHPFHLLAVLLLVSLVLAGIFALFYSGAVQATAHGDTVLRAVLAACGGAFVLLSILFVARVK